MLREKVAEAAFVVTISEYNRRMIHEECGPSVRTEVAVIHCGVDLEDYQPNPTRSASAAAGPLRIVCIGTLHEVKGQTYLLEACHRLAERNVPFTCHLIGDGPDRPRLARQAEEGGIGDRVVFRGWLTSDEVRRALREADAVAAPSVLARNGSREGIPVALMEAMASGVAVVASRISESLSWSKTAETARWRSPRTRPSWPRRWRSCNADGALRQRLASAGRVTVEEGFRSSPQCRAAPPALSEEHLRRGAAGDVRG
jgi:glycosyltransferase involved in cell wall biosynthesis